MSETETATRLTQSDVIRLMSDPSPEARIETTAKIAGHFESPTLSPGERQLAEDIFRALVKDAEVRVREALSAHLKSMPGVPHDVALQLARDVDSVALPMLKCSEVLTDEDLIGIVQEQGGRKQVAIAQRAQVSARVADALIDSGNETAVAKLVANEGAELTENALERVVQEYESSEAVTDSLSRRPSLPGALAQQFVDALTERLEKLLVSRQDLPADLVSNLIMQARERATMSLLDHDAAELGLERLVEQLHRRNRLTPSLLLRALCLGDMTFFEQAMARLSGVPLQNARILIHDEGRLGLESLYLRAGLPRRLFPAFRAGVDVARETDYDGGANDRGRYVERLLQRILTQSEDPSARLAPEDLDYLMHKLQQLAA